LVRNSGAKWEIGRRQFNHQFDGLAMLHGFTFQRGQVSYRNRFLQSSQYQAAQQTGTMTYTEFATDPCPQIFCDEVTMYKLGPVPNANVTVKQLGEKFIAYTEYPLGVTFNPKTLETLGVDTAAQSDAQLSTVHPHLDPFTGEVVDYQVRIEPNTAYIVRAFKDGSWRKLGEAPTQQIRYLHSFALTPRYVVLLGGPYMLNPSDVLLDRRPFVENYAWDDHGSSQFIVFDRASGQNVATLEGEPMFLFHHINAFEQGNQVVIDVCGYKNAQIIDDLYLAKLRGERVRVAYGDGFYTRRATLDLNAKAVTVERLGDPVELPRIHYDRFNTRPYRYAWGVAVRDPNTSGHKDIIRKLDTRTGSAKIWHEPGCFPGEPIFVRAPRSHQEDGGVLLSVVLDGRAQTSFLLVLDARSLNEVGRASVPHHIPFSFHGELFAV
jgi:carotenoid cleavage dioxygenase-like enzyme